MPFTPTIPSTPKPKRKLKLDSISLLKVHAATIPQTSVLFHSCRRLRRLNAHPRARASVAQKRDYQSIGVSQHVNK